MNADEAARRFQEIYHQIFLRLHRRLQAGEIRLRPEGLGVLRHLAVSGPLTVTEAQRHFDRSQAAMSAIITRLEQRGLVKRIPDERDRRRSLVWLTQDGRRVVERESSALSPTHVTRALRRMSREGRAALVNSLEALLVATRTAKGDAADPRDESSNPDPEEDDR